MNAKTIRYLTQNELKRLFSVIKSKRDRAIFFLAYRHGLRASEIGLLRRDDLDFEKGRIYIQRLKGSISQTYPFQADEIKILKSYLRTRPDQSPILFPSKRGTPIDRTTLHKLVKKYAEQADIPKDKRYFHCLKHTIATHLLDAQADLMFIKDWLGTRTFRIPLSTHGSPIQQGRSKRGRFLRTQELYKL